MVWFCHNFGLPAGPALVSETATAQAERRRKPLKKHLILWCWRLPRQSVVFEVTVYVIKAPKEDV